MTSDKPKAHEYHIGKIDSVDGEVCLWRMLSVEPRCVGYWTYPGEPETKYYIDPRGVIRTDKNQNKWILPHPRDAVVTSWEMCERLKVIDYLDVGHCYTIFAGYSSCRFGCRMYPEVDEYKPNMGCQDLTDGTWIYPEGYSHYLEFHDVKPPEDFLRHIRNNNYLPRLLEVNANYLEHRKNRKAARSMKKKQKKLLKDLERKLRA